VNTYVTKEHISIASINFIYKTSSIMVGKNIFAGFELVEIVLLTLVLVTALLVLSTMYEAGGL